MIVETLSLVGRYYKPSPIHLYVGGQGLVGGGVGFGPCLLFFCLFVFQEGCFLLLVLLFFGKVVHHLLFYRRLNAGRGIELRHSCCLLLLGQLLANGVGRKWVIPGKHRVIFVVPALKAEFQPFASWFEFLWDECESEIA